MKKIYNIPLSCNFTEVLTNHFLEKYKDRLIELSDVVFLLPNRRACQTLKEAFVKTNGMHPTLLPQMRPLADISEDEILLSSPESSNILLQLPPAISPQMRQMLFIKIIMSKPADFGMKKISLNQAAFLASDLGNLIDLAYNFQLDFDNLKNLVPEEYASHWQETLKFLRIITSYWPTILEEQGVCDAIWRKNKLIEMQCDIWQKESPQNKIIIAGTTAAFPTMKKLVHTVSNLPNGEIYLHGLDKNLDNESWQNIDEGHPQYELKELIDFLQIKREEISDFIPPTNANKEFLISEIMRPAQSTNKWRNLVLENTDIQNISIINAPDIRQEALSIALKMRETLESSEQTVALVTSDRNLARRVSAELKRWDIKIDDSAGRPLLQTPPAIFFRQILAVLQSSFAPVEVLSLLKHPMCQIGLETSQIRKQTRNYEIYKLRKKQDIPELEKFYSHIKDALNPLKFLFEQTSVNLNELIKTHIQVAEKLSMHAEKKEQQIWRGEDGIALAKFFNDIISASSIIEDISPKEYKGLLEALLSKHIVHSRYGTHPRLKILGPIEARLQHFDITIIGEVNEGIWPLNTSSDPWMSRPMKKEFGFPLPERNIGVTAHDFSELLCAPNVIISRAERVMGTPMVKSRWLLRFETILKALNKDIKNIQLNQYTLWSEQIDKPKKFISILPPSPRPPLLSRPRTLSVSAIELWMRDPYSIFAKYILNLKPLDDFDINLTLADYGNIVHKCLEEFNNLYPKEYPQNAKEELLKLGKKHFSASDISTEKLAFWLPKFSQTIDWIINIEQAYRQNIKIVHNEKEGEYEFDTPSGKFTIKAKADRIDETNTGDINIIDYKTGAARSIKEVSVGFAPQLPLEGLIASEGGFKDIKKSNIQSLIYWQLGKKVTEINEEVEKIISANFNNLKKLISAFDFETTAYICHPNPKKLPQYSDYEHLARVKEWSISGDNND